MEATDRRFFFVLMETDMARKVRDVCVCVCVCVFWERQSFFFFFDLQRMFADFLASADFALFPFSS